uniref:Uncharacterized protein n=1 Tax=Anguilla anguilla TaxID=7936 RepID=A0A0E9TMG9_ANGAN
MFYGSRSIVLKRSLPNMHSTVCIKNEAEDSQICALCLHQGNGVICRGRLHRHNSQASK